MTAKQDDSEIHWSLTCPNSHAHCISKREKKESICYINPLHVHQNICMYLLHTVLYTSLTKMLTRRICLTIKSFFSWWLFSLLLWPKCLLGCRVTESLGETRCSSFLQVKRFIQTYVLHTWNTFKIFSVIWPVTLELKKTPCENQRTLLLCLFGLFL